MLIKITDKCKMNCIHCLDDARPDNDHFMSYEDFIKSVDFFNNNADGEFIISGGEPMEHPYFWMFLEYALDFVHNSFNTPGTIVVTTNGMYMDNDAVYSKIKDYQKKYNMKVFFQVTSVDEYYPIKINLNHKVFSLESVYIARKIESMYPMGRAITNNIPCNQSKCSKCFNIRSIIRSIKDMKMATRILATKGKFCTPSICYNGDIRLGESRLCPVASNIYKPQEEIIKDICNFTCSNNVCKSINSRLPKEALEAIGEI
jgi:organic radical activating enzyme